MNDKRIVSESVLDGKDVLDRFVTSGSGAETIDGLCGECDGDV